MPIRPEDCPTSEARWAPRRRVHSVRDVQARRKRAGPEACLRGGPATERSKGGWAAAEVAAGHVRSGGRGAEVPWERSEYGAGVPRPDGADQTTCALRHMGAGWATTSVPVR